MARCMRRGRPSRNRPGGGLDGSVIVEDIKEKSGKWGFNAVTNEVVDMGSRPGSSIRSRSPAWPSLQMHSAGNRDIGSGNIATGVGAQKQG